MVWSVVVRASLGELAFWIDLAGAAWAILCGFTKALSVLLALRFYRKAPPPPARDYSIDHGDGLPPSPPGRPLVSVMKPVKGKDPGLYENLASFCALEGVPHEVLFCAAHKDDAAVAIVEEVLKDHPSADARLVITGDRPGHNPKVTNLAGAWDQAKGDLLLIADSNVRCRPDYLVRLVEPFADSKVGCTYNLFMSRERGGTLGARLQSLSFNTTVVSAITSAYALSGYANVIGKTMMLRRSAFEAIGGLEAVKEILCEDAIIGRRLQRAGFKVVLVPQLGETILGDLTLRQFWDHELRWARLTRFTVGAFNHFARLFWISTFNLLVALALALAGARAGAAAMLGAVFLQLFSDAAIWRAYNGRKRDAWLLPFLDGITLVITLLSFFGRDVHWRGQTFHLGPETRILRSKAAAPASALPSNRTR